MATAITSIANPCPCPVRVPTPTRGEGSRKTAPRTVVKELRSRRIVRCLADGSNSFPSTSSSTWETDDGGVIFSAEQIAQASGGSLVRGGAPGSICTDSRFIVPGQWFVALSGENFDGYAFLEDAARAGCAGAICSQPAPESWIGGYVLVDDTLTALQRLAANVRDRFKGPVVGITGSVGKTTTRSLTALALRRYGEVHHTRGNLNNHIGLPLTLLRMPSTAKVCVLEMGMSGFGEIETLAEICRPTIRVITNVGPVHLEGVGGSLEGVARAKGELFATAGIGDVCIINADDELVSSLKILPGCEVLSFGRAREGGKAQPDVVFDEIRSVELREVDFKLTVTKPSDVAETRSHRVTISEPGVHLAQNAAAAAAVAKALRLPFFEVCQDLSGYESLEMRMRVKEVSSKGITCIDDAYNASPISVMNALKTLNDAKAEGDGRRTVVMLGDMLELGSASQGFHEDIVDACLDYGFDFIGLAGPEFSCAFASVATRRRGTVGVVVGKDARDLWEKVKGEMDCDTGMMVLVKGSRGMKMDFIVERFTCTSREEK